jgi:aspartate racemase
MSVPGQKTVGVIGGMGPWATALFFESLLRLTPARKDWEHLHVVIDSNPHIPSRTRHYLFGEPSPVQGMIDAAGRLAAYPVDVIAVPCNSASFFLPQVRAAVAVPILDIFAITAAATARLAAPGGRIAVLAGTITHRERCYRRPLAAAGLVPVEHPDATQRAIEALIERLKLDPADRDAASDLRTVVTALRDELQVGAVVLGCTELGYLREADLGVKVVDSSLELARATVALARG